MAIKQNATDDFDNTIVAYTLALSKIANCYENYAFAPESRKAFHAKTISDLLPEAVAAPTQLQEQFGNVNGGNQPRFSNEQMAETAKAAGGVLVIKNDTASPDAINIARQMVADGKASERMKSELYTFDKHARIIAQAEAEGLTVHSNIHTFHKCALRWIEGEIVKMNQINSGSLVRVADAAPDEEADPWLTYSPSPNDDAGTGHFDGLTAIEESKRTLVY